MYGRFLHDYDDLGALDISTDGRTIIYPVHQKGVTNLWVKPLGASQGKPAPPRQWTHFLANGVCRFAISPDGKQIVLVRHASTTDMVLLITPPKSEAFDSARHQ